VQVRECQFRPNRYNKVRKQYYLCGWNENGNAFAHPVDSVARSKTAMNTYEGGVVLALSRIWDCKPEDVDKVKRNGDVAFVPCTPPIGAVPALQAKIVLAGSHVLTCERIQIKDGVYYAYGPASIRHTKRQHKAVRVGQGCWRVMVGLRFQKWGFSEPTAD